MVAGLESRRSLAGGRGWGVGGVRSLIRAAEQGRGGQGWTRRGAARRGAGKGERARHMDRQRHRLAECLSVEVGCGF